ncbi:MAG: prolyl oligopeptidase family serine peptidase, partial [Rickettsiales bacterium]
HKFFHNAGFSISPCEKFMAYSVDCVGNEFYTTRVRNLHTKEDLPDTIKDVIGAPTWNNESNGFYYTKLDKNWRPNKVYYHKIGDEQKNDKLIYSEQDKTFRLGLSKSTDGRYIFMTASSSTSQELMIIKNDYQIKTLIKRSKDHLFEVDHFNNIFYLLTNDKGKNFRLIKATSEKNLVEKKWVEIIKHSKNDYLTDFQTYDDHLIITKKISGVPKIFVFNYDMELLDELKFEDDSYYASHTYSWHDDDGFIVNYSSLRTPSTTYKYFFKEKSLKTLKEQIIPSGYKKEHYVSERIYVKSRDGLVKIPVSLIYKKSLFHSNGKNPLLLYGYGSYGISIPATFNTNILSLLDRGFVFAIAHVRGGDDLGFEWYESAKFLNKKRTFDDFSDILKFFVKSKYSSTKKISVMGGSAGGMLVGVTLNNESNLINSAIADVPFVDVLNTMLDETLPLTPGEFKEWGDPKEKKFFDYILSYSPYDNIKKIAYPNILVLAGLHDPRVTYWEPAKYVAKLRESKTDNNILVLETEMHAGHKGATARFERYKELAKKYAFLLSTHNINS